MTRPYLFGRLQHLDQPPDVFFEGFVLQQQVALGVSVVEGLLQVGPQLHDFVLEELVLLLEQLDLVEESGLSHLHPVQPHGRHAQLFFLLTDAVTQQLVFLVLLQHFLRQREVRVAHFADELVTPVLLPLRVSDRS